MIVGIKTKFDAAHYLPGYKGKCSQMHGHTWTVEVEVYGNISENGMVVDFIQLKEELKKIIDQFDHNVLNAIIENPTCENIVTLIQTELRKQFSALISVKVTEGEGGWAKNSTI